MASRRQLKVDWPACKAHGVCAELVPELVTLDEWGYPIIAEGTVPRPLTAHAQRAVTACPTLALSLIDAPGGRGRASTGETGPGTVDPAEDPATRSLRRIPGNSPAQPPPRVEPVAPPQRGRRRKH